MSTFTPPPRPSAMDVWSGWLLRLLSFADDKRLVHHLFDAANPLATLGILSCCQLGAIGGLGRPIYFGPGSLTVWATPELFSRSVWWRQSPPVPSTWRAGGCHGYFFRPHQGHDGLRNAQANRLWPRRARQGADVQQSPTPIAS